MLKIYGVPVSVHTRKAIVAAIAKGLPHEIVPVVPVIPDNPPPDWRRLSPTGKIPAIVDGDFTLFDSAAICAYLERLRPEPALYPGDPRGHARALAMEQYAGTLFREIVHPLFHETFVNPKVRGVATDQRRIDAVLADAVPEIFGYLDSAAGDGFLVGGALSIADIAVASNLVTYQYIGYDPYRARFPRLATLFDRVVRQPPFREALRREQAVAESMGLRRDFLAAALA
jgi:glutathione S-transferase